MKRWIRYVAITVCIVGLLACLTGCGRGQKTQGENKSQDQTPAKEEAQDTQEASTDTILNLEQGGIVYSGNYIAVQLDENLTTGYEWKAAVEGSGLNMNEDSSVTAADLEEAQKAAGEKSEALVGQGGYHLYGFEGTAAGKQTITFTYARSWEGSKDDIIITVKVETDAKGTILSLDLDVPYTTEKA